MSEITDDFLKAFGPPDPAVPNGVAFRDDSFVAVTWRVHFAPIGAGFFLDRFLYLFGERTESFRRCLDAWSFLVPPNHPDRVILGRNAYGAIVYVDDAHAGRSRVSVLDPLSVSVYSTPEMDLIGFFSRYLPKRLVPHFLDDSVYRAFLGAGRLALDEELVLGIKVPLSLGGEMKLDNFHVESLVSYYETTAPIYAKALSAR